MASESCYLCRDGRQLEDEAVSLRCECPYWTHEACLAKAVFETGCCPTCRTSMLSLDDNIVLASAAREGNLSKVQELLEKGIRPSPRSIIDSTPLLAAAEGGHIEIIRLLLKQGASVSEQDRYQRTAMYWASKGGHKKSNSGTSLASPTVLILGPSHNVALAL
jgi:ankyrin repeat protein